MDRVVYVIREDFAATTQIFEGVQALAGADAATRRACLDAVNALRPLYGAGSQCRGRADWALYRWLLTLLGGRGGLWAASLFRR